MKALVGCIDRGLAHVAPIQEEVREMTSHIRAVAETLCPKSGPKAIREERFREVQSSLADDPHPWKQHAATVMESFLPGLFCGDEKEEFPRDNGDLERWFRIPKGHERRIHGHRHAGIRIVIEGSILLPTLDAHFHHPDPFPVTELLPYRSKQPPMAQAEAGHRRTIMRRARSRKQRVKLLSELETRYQRRL